MVVGSSCYQTIFLSSMNIIKDKEFQGERPLFFQQDLRLENIKILNGESAIKEGHNTQYCCS